MWVRRCATIENGWEPPTKEIKGSGKEVEGEGQLTTKVVIKANTEWIDEENDMSAYNQKGLNSIFTAVSAENFEKCHCQRIQTSTTEFYARLSVVVNACSNLGDAIPEHRIVKKILRSLPMMYHTKKTVIEECKNLNNYKLTELIGSLTTYEMEFPEIKKNKGIALNAVKEDGSDNVFEDKIIQDLLNKEEIQVEVQEGVVLVSLLLTSYRIQPELCRKRALKIHQSALNVVDMDTLPLNVQTI
ncbi:unnamed protein product [Prunus armeniaca]|uniref:Uncharacterized protein n=1 Tax=Prunus armeniaca TaxID=36596 RepID=A0A6J5X5L9_PRUAR|nr:unnamed protein product [Prunus armeniaca]